MGVPTPTLAVRKGTEFLMDLSQQLASFQQEDDSRTKELARVMTNYYSRYLRRLYRPSVEIAGKQGDSGDSDGDQDANELAQAMYNFWQQLFQTSTAAEKVAIYQ